MDIEEIMSEEAFNELIDNFEVVETLTEYGRKAIKQNVKKLQNRIKELEAKLEKANKQLDLDYVDKNYIPKQEVKDLIKNETINIRGFECIAVEDYILEKERLATMQTLAYCRDNLEELLEEK